MKWLLSMFRQYGEIAIVIALCLALSILIPVAVTNSDSVLVFGLWTTLMFIVLLFAVLLTAPQNGIVISTKSGQKKRDGHLKDAASNTTLQMIVEIMRNTFRATEYIQLIESYENGAIHINELIRRVCDLVLVGKNEVARLGHELQEARSAHTFMKRELEQRVQRAEAQAEESAKLFADTLEKLGRSRAAVENLFGRVCNIMEAMLILDPEKVTGEQLRYIRVTLGAEMLYATGRCAVNHCASGNDRRLKVVSEAAAVLYRGLTENANNVGQGEYNARVVDPDFTNGLARMVAEYEAYKLEQAERVAAAAAQKKA